MLEEKAAAFRPVPKALLAEIQALPVADLLTLLGFAYGHSSGVPSSRLAMVLGDPTEWNENKFNHSLLVKRSRKTAAIVDVQIHGNKTVSYETAVSKLRELLAGWKDALLEPLKSTTAYQVLFTRAKVDGHYTLPNEFSIRAMPQDAPRSGEHSRWQPFVLTYSYLARSNHLLKNKAMAARTRELELFLNLLLPHGVERTLGGHSWVIEPRADGKPPKSHYFQLGYLAPGVDLKPMFIFPETPSNLPTVDAPDCYSFPGPRGIKGLYVPSFIASSYTKLKELDVERRAVFEAAARHFAIACRTSNESLSYGHIALVSAIETIANHWAKTALPVDKCAECRQPRFKLTERFKSFLRTYADKDSAPLYREFYRTRSVVLHAGEFLRGESMGLWDMGFEGSYDHFDFRYLLNLTRVAIVNWIEQPSLLPAKKGGGA